MTSTIETAVRNGSNPSAPGVEDQLENMRVSGDGAPSEEDEDIVNPWNVCGKSDTGIDYDKLISEFIPRNVLVKQLI